MDDWVRKVQKPACVIFEWSSTKSYHLISKVLEYLIEGLNLKPLTSRALLQTFLVLTWFYNQFWSYKFENHNFFWPIRTSFTRLVCLLFFCQKNLLCQKIHENSRLIVLEFFGIFWSGKKCFKSFHIPTISTYSRTKYYWLKIRSFDFTRFWALKVHR